MHGTGGGLQGLTLCRIAVYNTIRATRHSGHREMVLWGKTVSGRQNVAFYDFQKRQNWHPPCILNGDAHAVTRSRPEPESF